MSRYADPRRIGAGVALVAAVDLVLVGSAVAMVVALRTRGRPTDSWADVVASAAAVVVLLAVGAAVVLRVPANPVGWILLAIPTVYAVDGVLSFLPAWANASWSGVVASLEQPMWVILLGLIGFAFLLVPDGRPPSDRWRRFGWVGAVLVMATYVVVVVTPNGPLGGAQAGIPQTLGISALDNPVWRVVRGTLAVSTLILVALSVVSVGARYRRADADTRRQLKWVALSAVSVPVFVVTLVLTHLATGGTSRATGVVTTVGFDLVMLSVPVGMALAVVRYRLYSVDAVVDSAVVWACVSAVVLLVAAVVVLGTGVLAGRGSPAVAALATGIALLAVRPVHRFVQRRVNRRFHRQAYDAVQEVAAYTARLSSGDAPLEELEPALRRATATPGLRVLLPLADGRWASASGEVVDPEPGVAVRRGDFVVAVLVGGKPDVVTAAGDAAALALDNARLRAETLAQVAEVRASRARIVEAQLAERRRLERNLHDAVQQRLVAAALGLTLAREAVTDDRICAAIELINETVKTVREIGRGLHPAALSEGGLVAAVESLTDRMPLPVAVELGVPDDLAEDVAAGAYFAVAEALANALKHAQASHISVSGAAEDGVLRVAVTDDGTGGARIRASGGLAGLRDRIEALGGTVRVADQAGGGTTVQLEIPVGCDARRRG